MPEDKDSKTSSRTLESSDSAGIKALVQSFRVCWDVCPAEILVKNAIRKIGFDLELFGTPECGTEHVDPGCQHCLRVESALTKRNCGLDPASRESYMQIRCRFGGSPMWCHRPALRSLDHRPWN